MVEVADHIDGLKVWFRTFEEFVAKKIQYGDLEEAKALLLRRGLDFDKDKIVRLLTAQQKAELELILKESKPK